MTSRVLRNRVLKVEATRNKQRNKLRPTTVVEVCYRTGEWITKPPYARRVMLVNEFGTAAEQWEAALAEQQAKLIGTN